MSSSYIVTFKKGTPQEIIDAEAKKVEETGATITHRYNSAIHGYAVSVPDSIVSSLSLANEHVDGVEADGEVSTLGQSLLQ
ncbi:hypothetical protein J3Q64DRAFT_1779852 [Phycomyces blakesleeanus]|uniref:Inhibitor I9 domain-containing protein n=2 Tax=Phycomyces blakesleeanus TaxID=4837 RepID=A0A162WF65_PHYB8|nr:hypothetical protein PHYBLDRAFT_183806 [Phycomyces blakesleeanus NRRL 1555(-)]OAD66725.1 hypothetical protein PHYBLDRAFT_183806 [Phycomyces blakesleeanus NRRL 1555(-)]|eukprot:XP_018284765.1 hypothetical protein PHYBLDRAFT_183806 [Phycomyces blakesleeanus NRRL 1555(-)]